MYTVADLPLRWTRTIVLFLQFVLSIVASALCIKMFTMQVLRLHPPGRFRLTVPSCRHKSVQRSINQNAPTGITVDIKYTGGHLYLISLYA